jgi:hypothetical protein
MTRWIFGPIIVVAVAACDGSPTEVAGGSTEDFNGSGMPCTHAVTVPLDDEEAGFASAVEQVRGLIEGDYSVPIVWVDPCSSDYECGYVRGCADVNGRATPPADLIGTETTVHVSIHATGEDAIVLDDQDSSLDGNENEMEAQCAEEVRIPASVALRSDDGALDEEFAVDIWSDNLSAALVKLYDLYPSDKGFPVSALHGTLPQLLPSASTVEFDLSTRSSDEGITYSQGIRIGGEQGFAESPILEGVSSTAISCPLEISRDSVLD